MMVAMHPDPPWWSAALSMSTGLTNLVMISSPVVLFLPRFKRWISVLAGAGLTSFLFNAYWYIMLGEDRTDLRAGYFLWWVSFLLLGLGAFSQARALRSNSNAA